MTADSTSLTRAVRRGGSRALILFGFLLATVLGVGVGLLSISVEDMPDIADLHRYTASPATKLFDNSTPPELIAQLAIEQRTFVSLARIPRTLLDATVAIEDERFFTHWGLDLWGIARAAVVNSIRGRIVEGGSTITQQLARTLFLTRARTLQRKIKEALLAIQIERQYKKEEILEMYLNQVYFGHGAYGVEQAARKYFGKHVEELILPQSALLSGLLRAPNAYSPRRHPEKSVVRRNLVLHKMIENGFVERTEAEEATHSPLNLRETELTNAPYFAAHIRKHLEKTYGTQAVYRGGLSVYTTLNLRYQTIAQRALELGLTNAERVIRNPRRGAAAAVGLRLQGAIVVLDPRSGAILAMIGGRRFKESEYNRTTQAKRQPGSAFKPIIYTTALLNGYVPSDLIDDSPVQYTGKDGEIWQPINFERKFYGLTTLREGLAHSRNVVTIKLLHQVGVRKVISMGKKFGFTTRIRNDLTLGLGTSEVKLLELVSAFGVFAHNGYRAAPYSIKMVKDSLGNVLEQHRLKLYSVISPQVAYLMLSMLQDTVNVGTGRIVRRQGFTRPAGGKTGSTNDFTDAWFVGFTPSLACGVWIGYDDRRTMGKNLTGGLIAAPIWAAFMAEALEDASQEDFERPPGLVTVRIDATSGLLATNKCKRVVKELFLKGETPTRKCDRHDKKKSFADIDLEQLEKLRAPKNE